MSNLLEARGVEVAYGNVRAVQRFDLILGEDEAVAIVGPNGAGKTSAIHGLLGLAPVTSGKVGFAGHDLAGMPVYERARLGISLVPAGRWLFPSLSVQQNIELGRSMRADSLTDDEVYAHFPDLEGRKTLIAGSLSGGQQQMLALARALVAKPKLLILDEPSLGLAPIIVEGLYDKLADLRTRGTAIVVVEERTQFALELCDRYIAMSGGRIVSSAKTGSEDEADVIARSYLGGDLA